jgi:dihydroorotase
VYDLVIEDATIVSGEGRVVADIGVKRGKIAYVGTRAPGRPKQRISAIGKFVMPGIIDANVRLHAADHDPALVWETESRAAVSGGVTTMLEMHDGAPRTSTSKSLSVKRKAAKANSRVNFGFWAGATKKNTPHLENLLAKGAIGVCLDLGALVGPTAIPYDRLEEMFRTLPGSLGVIAQDRSTLLAARKAQADNPSPSHNDVRPPEAARLAVERVVSLVRATNRPVYLFGLSTAAELHLLDPIKGDLPITVEVSPNHLFLSNESEGPLTCNPPLREELDRRSLWTALRRNRIDTVASGHTPLTRAQKDVPYKDQPVGIPGVETTFPLLMGAVHHGRMGLERMVTLMSEGPAKALRLRGKGAIKKGYDADLVMFTEGQLEQYEQGQVLSQAGWSPYVGRELAGKPELVMVGGTIVSRRGKIVDDTARGTLVSLLPS